MRVFDLEKKIRPILENSYLAKCNDMYLYYQYIKTELKDSDVRNTFIAVFQSAKLREHLELASFGAVERVARELRKANPELTVSRVERNRFNKQQDYQGYAIGCNTNLA